MKKLLCWVGLLPVLSGVCYAQNKGLPLDDFEPRPVPRGTLYFDTVELVKQ